VDITKDEYNLLITYTGIYKVRNKGELSNIIKNFIKYFGNECNLNWIDVSNITDMYYLFRSTNFNGDISEWNVSNVTSMEQMFAMSNFNGDISKWDVSNVTNMQSMFSNSQFNQDISNWNVSNVINMCSMFWNSKFNGDIS
jgi:surface protein